MTHAITLESQNSKRQIRSIISMVMCCVMMLSVFMFLNVDVAFCASGEANSEAASAIQEAINDGAEQVITVMRAIVTPICIILIAFAGFQFLIGGQQGTEKARKTLMAAALGIAVVLLAPLFGQALATWFADAMQGDLSNYNPLA